MVGGDGDLHRIGVTAINGSSCDDYRPLLNAGHFSVLIHCGNRRITAAVDHPLVGSIYGKYLRGYDQDLVLAGFPLFAGAKYNGLRWRGLIIRKGTKVVNFPFISTRNFKGVCYRFQIHLRGPTGCKGVMVIIFPFFIMINRPDHSIGTVIINHLEIRKHFLRFCLPVKSAYRNAASLHKVNIGVFASRVTAASIIDAI